MEEVKAAHLCGQSQDSLQIQANGLDGSINREFFIRFIKYNINLDCILVPVLPSNHPMNKSIVESHSVDSKH